MDKKTNEDANNFLYKPIKHPIINKTTTTKPLPIPMPKYEPIKTI